MNRNLVTLLCVALTGAVLSFVVLPFLGTTMAFATPDGYSEWFRSFASVEIANLIWSFAVVGFLGAGVAVFLASLVALQFSAASRIVTLITFIIGFFIGGHVLVPIYYGQTEQIAAAFFGRGWWGYGVELAVICSAAAAGFVHSRLSRHRSGR